MSFYWTEKVEADKIIYTLSKRRKIGAIMLGLTGLILLIVLSLHVYVRHFGQLADHPYTFPFLGILGFFLIGVSISPNARIQLLLMSAQRKNKKTTISSTNEGEKVEIER